MSSGGSVLTTLLNSKKDALKGSSISALVRGEAQVQKVKELGVNLVQIKDLDDTEVIQKAASEHDGDYTDVLSYVVLS